MTVETFAYLTLFAPLIGCVLIALAGNRISAYAASVLGCVAVLAGFVGAVGTFLSIRGDEEGHLLSPYTWLSSSSIKVGFDLYVDPLSVFMMLVVTGVGFLIHVYSVGYMSGDDQQRRFFAYLNLFVFSMLMLVMAGNFVFLLIGWGLVGMASYLLIGFWNDRPTAVAASKKAFVVNAGGDVFLMLGLFLIFVKTGEFAYPAVFDSIGGVVDEGSGAALAICLLLLGGAAAKSAQLPLHTWLPDAMEGPTPVSALIHAATMVTAGVYLIARMHPIFNLSEGAQATVALMGSVTLVAAGLIALVQTDIKRSIAYSTMSQIGYMFVAVGIGASSAGMFHLMTHAFFKALLFLGAGIVIHALHEEQDMRKMGGLKTLMPTTYKLFMIASLALAGIIPLSGFFSKDEIIAYAIASANPNYLGTVGIITVALALIGVVLTGLYSFRLIFLVFHSEQGPASKHLAQEGLHDGHEAPRSMMVPVLVLGVLSVVGGWLVIPGAWNLVGDFLHQAHAAPTREALHDVELTVAMGWTLTFLVSLPLALLGIALARAVWLTGSLAAWRTRMPRFEKVLQSGFGWDGLYERIFYRPAAWLAMLVRRTLEQGFFVPSVDWVGGGARAMGRGVGRLHTGLLRTYAFGTAAGALAIVVWLVVEKV